MKTNSILQPLASPSIVDQIVERITNAIISGDLNAGDKIPTELELCDSMGVGRNSVREAIKILTSSGVLEIKRAEGTFVCSKFNDKMLDPMLYSLIMAKDSSADILELRRVFETGILDLAVRKAAAHDLLALEKALDEMSLALKSKKLTAENILELDMRFHQLLVKMADNPLIDKVSSIIERLTVPSRLKTISQIIDQGEQQQILQLHVELVNLIKNRQAGNISTAINHHFTYWAKEV